MTERQKTMESPNTLQAAQKRIWLTLLAAALSLGALVRVAAACSDVVTTGRDDGDKWYVSGRTLDYTSGFPSVLVRVPQGLTWDSKAPGGQSGTHWINRFGFIGVALSTKTRQFVDGLNEAGLSAAVLWQEDAAYPTPQEARYALSVNDLVSWVLGNSQNVNDVKNGLQDVTVWQDDQALPRPVHLVVHDARGASLLAEWVKGTLKVYTGTTLGNVVTNGPDYAQQRRNYGQQKYQRLSNNDIPWPGRDMEWIEGAGMLGMPGDPTSMSRFVRLSLLSKYALQSVDDLRIFSASGPDWSVQQMFHILGRADSLYGNSSHPDGSSGSAMAHTEWTLVRDHTQQRLYFRGLHSNVIRTIDLKKINFNSTDFKELGAIDEPLATSSVPVATFRPSGRTLRHGERIDLRVSIPVDANDTGKRGKYFVFAKLPQNQNLYWTGKSWKAWNTNLMPFRLGTLRSMSLQLLKNEPRSKWNGATIYAGYGESLADMFANSKFNPVYSAQ